MADQNTDTAAIAAASAALAAAQEEKPNPVQSFFVNILHHLPLPKNQPKDKVIEKATIVVKETGEDTKTTVVTFPKQEKELPSLNYQAQDADTTTNPLLLWQVYAIGGFFVLRWAWARWNERKGKKKPSNEEHSTEEPPNEDPPPPRS